MCDLSSVSEIKSFASKFSKKDVPIHVLVKFHILLFSIISVSTLTMTMTREASWGSTLHPWGLKAWLVTRQVAFNKVVGLWLLSHFLVLGVTVDSFKSFVTGLRKVGAKRNFLEHLMCMDQPTAWGEILGSNGVPWHHTAQGHSQGCLACISIVSNVGGLTKWGLSDVGWKLSCDNALSILNIFYV